MNLNCAAGGGDVSHHSSVSASQGFAPALFPHLKLSSRFTRRSEAERPNASAPTLDTRLYGSQPSPTGNVYTRLGIPSRPVTCMGKNVMLKNTNISQKLIFPSGSSSIRPVIFGSQ